MAEDQWTAVEQYFSKSLLLNDSVLESALEVSEKAGLPAISVSPTQGKFLQMLAQILGAQTILEIGTLGGYSTIWMARGLTAGGRILTLELDPNHAAVAQRNLAAAGLQDVVEVRVGNALEILPRLSAERRGPFDLIFIDADKQNIPSYFEWALKLSRPGTVIIGASVVRDGAVIEVDSRYQSVQGVRRFIHRDAGERRLTAT